MAFTEADQRLSDWLHEALDTLPEEFAHLKMAAGVDSGGLVLLLTNPEQSASILVLYGEGGQSYKLTIEPGEE